jgi:hypothetical protein
MRDIGVVQLILAQILCRALNVAPIKLFGVGSHLCHAATRVMSLQHKLCLHPIFIINAYPHNFRCIPHDLCRVPAQLLVRTA